MPQQMLEADVLIRTPTPGQKFYAWLHWSLVEKFLIILYNLYTGDVLTARRIVIDVTSGHSQKELKGSRIFAGSSEFDRGRIKNLCLSVFC